MKISDLIDKYKKSGFNEKQSKSLAWCDVFEEKMADMEYKYPNSTLFSFTIRVDTFCKDCKEGGQFLPDTVRNFIKTHKNHKTTTFKVR